MKLRSVLALLALNGAGMKWKQKERKKKEKNANKYSFHTHLLIQSIFMRHLFEITSKKKRVVASIFLICYSICTLLFLRDNYNKILYYILNDCSGRFFSSHSTEICSVIHCHLN